MSMVELVIASTNIHKIRELRSMLKPLQKFDVLSLCDFPDYIPPEETENTFEGNATLKALHAAKILNRWVIADDSGLVVPALGGAPGVYSARYAGVSATDLDNRKKLLKEMENLLDEERNGFFREIPGASRVVQDNEEPRDRDGDNTRVFDADKKVF